MSEMNLFGRRGTSSRMVEQERQRQVEIIHGRADIASVQLAEAATLFSQGETDLVNAVAQAVSDVSRVPAAAPFVEPLLRDYRTTIAGILRGSVR